MTLDTPSMVTMVTPVKVTIVVVIMVTTLEVNMVEIMKSLKKFSLMMMSFSILGCTGLIELY